ncbi:hypothetical protein BG011_003253 [Mortierella polycephala]|uniref:Uncharacterized protein n=1 Tax=Mortierella polycephala TaxID=41804 RepID=A0A9P6PJB0_9FUNG|nr:hypothetical protein BG011_003253 [Mortierella polycephala]
MPYPSTALTRSVAAQLCCDFKRMFRKGSVALHEQLKIKERRGILPEGCNIQIQADESAIKNYARLNKISRNRRRIVPTTPFTQPFVSFSELELLHFFWKSEALRRKVQGLINAKTYVPSLLDTVNWLSDQAPGFFSQRSSPS